MSTDASPVFVSALWLRDHLHDANVRVLEAVFYHEEEDEDSFKQKRIPGAELFQQWDVAKTKEDYVYWPEADPMKFQAYCRTLGLNSNDHIVIYDRNWHYICARLWYTFKCLGHHRVSVLNGGLQHWQAEGYDIETGPVQRKQQTSQFTVCEDNLNGKFIKFDEIVQLRETRRRQLLDVRRVKHYRGQDTELNSDTKKKFILMGFPVPPPFKAGHMPGAVSVCRDDFLDTNNFCFKKPEVALEVFREKKVDINKPTTAMCYIGLTACFVPLLYAYLGGTEDVSVYTGSWTEYGQRVDDGDVVKEDRI